MSAIQSPYPGIQVHTNSAGATVLRLHYRADPDKGSGELVHVAELKRDLTPWAKRQYDAMTDKALYAQEYEIDFHAVEGSLIYHMDQEATLEEAFPIPEDWTRVYALDPHPGVPHAHLWVAVDRWGDRWVYREFWPSKIYAKRGSVMPQDDNRATIRQHCEVVQYMESDENPQNIKPDGERFNERILRRVIDYTARAFGKDQDSPGAENYQRRFELRSEEIARDKGVEFSMRFEDAVKDQESGYDTVNEWLRPRLVETPDGKWVKKSRLHIFRERCPELIYELTNARRKVLTPEQQARMEPDGKPIPIRVHLADCLRYITMANPIYVPPPQKPRPWSPPAKGLSY